MNNTTVEQARRWLGKLQHERIVLEEGKYTAAKLPDIEREEDRLKTIIKEHAENT